MITPIDIQGKEFEIKVRGYDRDEVDKFLDVIIHDLTELTGENEKLKSRAAVLEETLARYKTMENEMSKSIDAARETAAGIIKNARDEAAFIEKKAQLNAKELDIQLDREYAKKRADIAALTEEYDAFRRRIRALCETLKSELE